MIGCTGKPRRDEELDVVKSLELTAEGSYDEGYRKGQEAGVEWMIQCAVTEVNTMATTYRDTELLMEVKRRIRENGQAQLERLKE